MESKYLEFIEDKNYDGKTKRFVIHSKKHACVLGIIKWYGAWRQYTFWPATDTLWNKDCLKDVQDFLQELMDERKPKSDTIEYDRIQEGDWE